MSFDISVVIPTYNRAEQLSEALRSVIAQENCVLEIIVVDDTVDQSARSIVSQFQHPKLQYVANPHPSGGFPSRVRNLGATFATGRFVHFLDDDDRVPAALYPDVVRYFDENPGVGVVFGQVIPFGSDAVQIEREKAFFKLAARSAANLQRYGKCWPMATRMTFSDTLLVCGAALIRRECIAGSGGFDPNIRYGEDADFYARAIRRYGGRFVERAFLEYRIWPNSIAHTPDLPPDAIANDYKRIHERFLREAGIINYTLSKVAARTILRMI